MDDLKKLIGELKEKTNKEEIVSVLQGIGKKLVTEYEIIVDGTRIKPIIVEAYYYNAKTFPDCNTHLSPLQKEFDVLYRHSTKKGLKSSGRVGGVDICLASNTDNEDDTYYLSFLIKNSLLNNEFCKQVKLNAFLNEIFDSEEIISQVLQKRSTKHTKECIYCPRKGLTKDCYKSEPIAIIYPWDNVSDDLSLWQGKEKVFAQFMFENDIEETDDNIKNIIGYKSSKIKAYIEQLKQGKEI